MKNTSIQIFVFALLFTLCFTSCQKDQQGIPTEISQKITLEEKEASYAASSKQLDEVIGKTLDKSLAPTTQPIPAAARASKWNLILGCGSFEKDTNRGKGNSFNFYGFEGEDELYYFYPQESGTFVIDLFGLSNDLDVFLLERIGNSFNVIAYSANYKTAAERMIANLTGGGKYAILVDAYQAGLTSNFKITLKCFDITPLDDFNTYQAGDKVAEVSNALLRFDPNQTDDAVIAGYGTKKKMVVSPGMKPLLMIDRFEQDREGYVEARNFKMKIPYGKNARLGIEKSEYKGIAGTCLIDLESDGSVWIRVQGQWHRSSKRYTQGQWMEVQIAHFSEIGEYTLRIDNELIVTLTSDLQVEQTTSGSRDYAGISLQTFNQKSMYEVEEIYPWEISPTGGSSRVKKRLITIDIN